MSQFQQKRIGRRLRVIIKASGYPTYERFAYENGFDKGWIGRILRGEIDPGITKAIKIARSLNVTLDDLYPMERKVIRKNTE